jgi:SHS2 domain-containing protein
LLLLAIILYVFSIQRIEKVMSSFDPDSNSSDPSWEALPPRKNRRRRRRGEEEDEAELEGTHESSSSSSAAQANMTTATHMTTAQLAATRIAENIAARAKVNRTQTTLESQDGCAGEFYECKLRLIISYFIPHTTNHTDDINITDLDHTADVQCHAWGANIVDAFQNMAECMLNYMTDIKLIQEDPEESVSMKVSGSDIQSLLYNYMNELLFKFVTDNFCAVRVVIGNFDRENNTITATL